MFSYWIRQRVPAKNFIYVNFSRDHEFVFPDGRSGKSYDTVDKVWQHLLFISIYVFCIVAFYASNLPMAVGILEGINSKIQLAKRRARGFRNIKNFINMID